MPRQRALRPVPDQPGRVVLYTRVSAVMGRTSEEFHSPELQEQAMRRLAAGAGLREIAAVQDIDQTGRTFSREGLNQIRAMVEARQVDVVAVYDLSRLGRNTAEALAFVRWLREHGVAIISTREQIDDSPEGQYMLTQFLGMAQLYSDQMGRRWEEVIALRARDGKSHGTPPIGYLREEVPDAPTGRNGRRPTRVVADTLLGPAMTDAFSAYAAGEPISKIAQRIGDIAGRRIDLATVRRALHNPYFTGKTVLWGLGAHKHPKPTDEPLYVGPGDHPALVDQAVWDRVQRRLRRDSQTVERRHLAMGWSLAGLVHCADCRKPLQYHRAVIGRGTEKVPRLRCGDTGRRARAGCAGVGTPHLERVEVAVLEQLARWARDLRTDTAEQTRQRAQIINAGVNRDGLQAELDDNRAQQAKLVERWLAGKVPDAAYDVNRDRLVEVENGLRERLAELGDTPQLPTPAQVLTLIDRVMAVWDDAIGTERRVMLAAVIRRVEVRRPNYWREDVRDRVRVEFLW